MKRGAPLTRRTALARTSWWRGPAPKTVKRRRPSRENGAATWWRTRQWVLDRAKGRCEARIDAVCTGRAEHVHHLRLRSQGGSDDPSNLAALCHACHDWVHANPAAAHERGLIRRRGDAA